MSERHASVARMLGAAAACLLLAACHAPPLAAPPTPDPIRLAQWEVVRPPPPAAAAVIRARWEAHRALRDALRAVVFLNFEGATIEPGADSDAVTNTSWLASQRVDYPAFDARPLGLSRDEAVGLVTEYLAFLFGGFDVTFVTARPATGEYTMVMIGGDASVMGQGEGTLGMAPLDCDAGSGSLILNLNPSDIVFIFSDDVAGYGLSLWDLASATAHELAHTYGLAHVLRDFDIMNANLTIGTTRSWGASGVVAGEASCNYFQDDVSFLIQAVGQSATTDPAAQAYVTDPASGEVVDDSLVVEVAVSAPAADTRVNLLVDGVLRGSCIAEPYSFPLPGLPPGAHSLKARVQTMAHVGGSNVVNVFVAGPTVSCTRDADCSDAGRCRRGTCVGPPPSPQYGELGAACQYDDDCVSGRCVVGSTSYCSRACREDVGALCSFGYECGAEGYCLTEIGPGGGGCASASTPGTPGPLGVILLLLLTRRCRGAS